MDSLSLIFILILLSVLSYWYGMKRSVTAAGGISKIKEMTSLPQQFGMLTAFWCGLPALFSLLIWMGLETHLIHLFLLPQLPENIQLLNSTDLSLYLNEIKILAQTNIEAFTSVDEKTSIALYLQSLENNIKWIKTGLILVIAFASVAFISSRFEKNFKARLKSENIIKYILLSCSALAIVTTLGIVISVLFESVHFFGEVPASEFLFGTKWSPMVALRSDQVGSSGSFGAIPLFVGTLLISFIAMIIAVPTGLMIATYLSQYASAKLRMFAKPMLEILAGVPTVVYGFFAALTVAPFIRDMGDNIGVSVASQSALAAGIVMGVMIIPFVSSLSDDAMGAVPISLKEASLGLGATPSETILKVIIPAALPGIIGAILLAVSRAIGETMIVVMAAGLAANLSINPLESVTTVTVQIVTLLTGDQEFDSPKTLAAFALGLMLFVTTLALNIIALKVVRKYREQYD